jgi:hypothetical protein
MAQDKKVELGVIKRSLKPKIRQLPSSDEL